MAAPQFSTLQFFKRRRVAQDVRLAAARGELELDPVEHVAVALLLQHDENHDVRTAAATTLARLSDASLRALAVADAPPEVVEFCTSKLGADAHGGEPPPVAAAVPVLEAQTVVVDGTAQESGFDAPAAVNGPLTPDGLPPAGSDGDEAQVEAALADADSPSWIDDDPVLQAEEGASREGIVQQLAKMSFSERLKAAMKGSREVRAILIRDPSKMIASAVLKSPKLTEPEVEAFARLGNVAEDVLRTIGNNRGWMKNYGVVLALTKNAKTPLALSLNLLNRLNDRDVNNLSSDRNVPEPLRVAARKRVVSAVSRR